MRLFKLGFLPLVLLLSSCTNMGIPHPSAGPDKIELMGLLRSGEYEKLMQKLDSATTKYARDREHEEYFWRAFDTFNVPDSSVEKDLNEWIREYPGCANAYAARAGFYMTLGWSIRGYGWARDVTQEHWNLMNYYFEKAWSDATKGLQIDSLNLTCYTTLIAISMHYSDKNLTASIFSKAMSHDPGCLEVWTSYMWSLLPRWGGSHEEMTWLAEVSKQYLSLNPKLRVLQGYVAFDEGWTHEDDGSYDSAIAEYDTAISFGGRGDFYHRRGDCYYDIYEYDLALADYEQALQLSPQDPDYLTSEANAMFALEKFDSARIAAEEAWEISPADSIVIEAYDFMCGEKSGAKVHRKKGYDLLRIKDYQQALDELNQAAKIDTSDYVIYEGRGYCYKDLGRYDDAVTNFQHVIALRPSEIDAYSNLGWIHMQQRKYEEAVSEYSVVIEAKPNEYDSYMDRAFCLHNLGRNDEALLDLKTACDMGCEQACESYRRIMAP